MEKIYSKLTFDQIDEVRGVNFSDIEVGTYFTENAEGDIGLYQKISNGATKNTLYPLEDGPGELATYKPDDKVFVCDVELKWRVR
jgi:hypothetical protein